MLKLAGHSDSIEIKVFQLLHIQRKMRRPPAKVSDPAPSRAPYL
ncbi:hypothetical protein BIFPSEUDO_03961 [Bifidobacterium pseudocatenulatum DSM 20438 = JCM 1200 = LMG 10505]|uniref:Uncharacterized protein n=1 Tax=Bifidobacterium pseudocatenulatum DSM 20438 = JCM 1200 = LMG 10505 TaxID=547043 RepID=C0BU79_BIFPS|nr:hypothetical protein BIFPSEUDO_03961 [Bifidobacterium pseudocatenulatum DSM 20438 = JCM 1200 = LMG 10505]